MKFDISLLPDADQVWEWQEQLNQLGPRLTGDEGHRQFIDFLHRELESSGLEVFRDSVSFRKWEPISWDLMVENESGNKEKIPVTHYFPYSGITSAEGVSGELVYCGKAPGRFKDVKGKIAIVDVKVPELPYSLMLKHRRLYSHNQGALPKKNSSPVIASFLRSPNLAAAREAGAAGVVCVWGNCSSGNALHQYLPFTTPYQECPGLWVNEQTGVRLKQLASQGAQATLILNAVMDDKAVSDTIYAVLPGTNDEETVIVNTHTDGPNACEENGGVGLLALAQYFAKVPKEERKRTFVFVLVTGHFQLPQFGISNGQATSRWLRDHPEWWDGQSSHRTAVAGVTLEHLGCMEWKDTPDHTRYEPTGLIEAELVYTANSVMDNIYMNALEGRTKVRTVTLQPKDNIYLGEGQPLFQKGIPTISLIPGPDYLCAAPPNGGIDKLDPALLHEQIQTFAKVLIEIDQTSAEGLGKPEKQAFGLLGLFLKLFNKGH